MAISTAITKLRRRAKLSEAELSAKLGVCEADILAWETGEKKPTLDEAAKISKVFRVSIDALMMGDADMPRGKNIIPDTAPLPEWEIYSKSLHYEYMQCIEEGLDIGEYEDLFKAIGKMPAGEHKEKMADVLFDIVQNAPMAEGYPYEEPSDLESIRALCKEYTYETKPFTEESLRDKILGAWYGRICGCLLGKPVEGISCEELEALLKETGNYPMTRYILASDMNEDMYGRYKFPLRGRCYADTIQMAPVDDDTNYVALAQVLIDKHGRDFTPNDVATIWMTRQGKQAYCTAERIAFCNFIKGFRPPFSAIHKNSYREWIGAQIRGDYFGYINPGEPAKAADMAWRDACISHIKNGIYGELFASCAIACAAVTDDIDEILLGGLSYIPTTSRLYAAVMAVIDKFHQGVPVEELFADLHTRWDEHNVHDWCHTISNAEIVAACLLYGKGDYGKSICLAVEQGFDTDCNGATIGSILGMRGGMKAIDACWLEPLHGKLRTSIFGVDMVEIETLVEKTMKHIQI